MVAFVEPDECDDPVRQLESELARRGVPAAEATRLADLYHERPIASWWPNGAAEGALTEAARRAAFLEEAGRAYPHARSTAHARVRLLRGMAARGLMAEGPPPGRTQRAESRAARVGAVLDALGATMLPADVELTADDLYEGADSEVRDLLLRDLVAAGRVRAHDLIDLGRLREWDRFAQRVRTGTGEPETVGYWLRLRGGDALGDLLPVLRAEPDETLAPVAGAILQELEECIAFDWRADQAPSGELAGARATAATHLDRWREPLLAALERRPNDVLLLECFLVAGALGEQLGELSAAGASREPDLRLADRALGRLRVAARGDAAESAVARSPVLQLAYVRVLHALARHGGLARGLRAGTLVLRALTVPSVGADLRWWVEAGWPDPPAGWSWLPRALVGVVHAQGAREQASDPDLIVAREEFCGFLLERLKPRAKGGGATGLVEPSAAWRIGCVRAARELLANPGGRGHRVLWEVAHRDPDDAVRAAALKAYDDLRRAQGASGDTSPRRRIVAALWWLRQAHLFELGRGVDPPGARRTRQREISFTSEARQPTA